MKFWHKLSLLSMVLVMVFGTSVVMASTGSRMIEVIYQDIKLVVRGAAINKEEPFIYNGRTYVPLRTVAEALGEEVKYDGDTKTVYIGMVPVGDTFLSNMKPFDLQESDRYYVDRYAPDEPFMMGGRPYTQKGLGFHTGLMDDVVATYNLNGKYKTITGKIGYQDRDDQIPISIEIYGDDQKLFDMTPVPGQLPKDVTIDLKYALTLKILVKHHPDLSSRAHGTRLNFVNAVLHP